MKKGYLYLVVADRDIDGVNPYHFHDIGTLVVGCGGEPNDGAYDYEDEEGIKQFMLPEHVVEIGKI